MLLLGLTIGLFGIILSTTPYGRNLEQSQGLKFLFGLRGPIVPPDGATVIGVNTQMSATQGQGWDRRLLAELIDILVELDAPVIAINLFLSEQHEEAEDMRLQQAIKDSGRVILLQKAVEGEAPGVTIEPLQRFRNQAEAVGLFVVPEIPSSVDYFWPFLPVLTTPVGINGAKFLDETTHPSIESPSLPLAALHLQLQGVVASDVWNSLLLNTKPGGSEVVHQADHFISTVREVRATVRKNKALQTYLHSAFSDLDDPINNALFSLVTAYAWPGIRYINYYGPRATVPTIPSAVLIKAARAGDLEDYRWLQNQVVFIGYVPSSTGSQKGRHLTTFVQGTRDLSGVEIATTAYLNLRYREWIKPVVPLYRTLLIFLFGFTIGFLTLSFRPTMAIVSVIALSVVILGFNLWHFGVNQLWMPIVIPFAIQLPVSIFIGVLWQYLRTRKDRNLYRQGMHLYVPKNAIAAMVEKGGLPTESELTYCACLFADIAEFTTLCEKMNPVELAQFSNDYFTPLCNCVLNNSGDVLSSAGDEVLAVWSADEARKAPRMLACDTSLQMLGKITEFNEAHPQHCIFTRFGIHVGWLAMGNIGGGGHISYNVVGDAVNAAKRIEGLNKLLGTQILVTGEVVEGLDKFLTRPVGSFIVKGKALPLEVCELCCLKENAGKGMLQLHADFASAMSNFITGNYEAAYDSFLLCRNRSGDDGPTTFYLDLLSKPKKLRKMVGSEGKIHLKWK
jgi:adenylate cyclase